MAYTLARKERDAALWSSAGVQASDLVHLVSQVAGSKRKAKPKGDLMDGVLAQLWDDPDPG